MGQRIDKVEELEAIIASATNHKLTVSKTPV